MSELNKKSVPKKPLRRMKNPRYHSNCVLPIIRKTAALAVLTQRKTEGFYLRARFLPFGSETTTTKTLSAAHTDRRFSRKTFFAPFSSTPLLDDTTPKQKSQDAKAEFFDFFVRFFRFSLCVLENAEKMIYNERRKGSENVHRAFTFGCYTQKRLRSYNA